MLATFSDCYYPTGHFIALKRTYLPCDGCFASTLVDPRRELLGRETKNEREWVRRGKRERERGREKGRGGRSLQESPESSWNIAHSYQAKDTAGLSKPVTRCVITRDRYRSLDVDQGFILKVYDFLKLLAKRTICCYTRG